MTPELPVKIKGKVMYGRQIGRRIGIPTANIIPDRDLSGLPFGVYVSKVYIGNEIYKGVSNLGVKPTVQDEPLINVETHILGLDENLYGTEITVELLKFTRPEMKFSSVEALKNRIELDVKEAKETQI